MIQQDFYSGEVIDSPINEAANDAAFGAYYYAPNTQNNMYNQNMYMNYPNYYQGQNYYNPYNGQNNMYNQNMYMNYPNYYQGQNYYNPYNAQNNMYNQAIGIGYHQPNYYQYNRPQQIQYVQKGVSVFGGEFIPDINYEEDIRRLKMKYLIKDIESEGENIAKRESTRYGESNFYGNYYNMPYYNSNPYNNNYNEANREIEKIKDDARKRKKEFEINLALLAHNILQDGVTEKQIRDQFEDKVVIETDPNVINMYYPIPDPMTERFARMVPYHDPTPDIQAQIDRQVVDQFHQCVSPDADMYEFFENIGLYRYELFMEKNRKELRDRSSMYNTHTYSNFVKEKAIERYNNFMKNKNSNGIIGYGYNAPEPSNAGILSNKFLNQSQDQIINDTENFPTLKECATLSEDGTLNITFNNFGRGNPAIQNSQEEEYKRDKERFLAFLDSIPKSIIDYEDDSGGANNGE